MRVILVSTCALLSTCTTVLLPLPPQVHSKRPSFTWLQYQSPRKGLLTVLVLFGSHLATWMPFTVGATLQAVGLGALVPSWYVQYCTTPQDSHFFSNKIMKLFLHYSCDP